MVSEPSAMDILNAARRAVAGVEDAALRLREVGEQHTFVPLTEFLWWTISLDDLLAHRLLASDTFRYRSDRNTNPDGQVVAGLRYVRNAVGHSLLVVTRVEGGLTLPITLPMTISPIRAFWIDTDHVPPPNTPHPTNRMAYDNWVAGRPVTETTTAARRWLARQMHRLNTESGYYR